MTLGYPHHLLFRLWNYALISGNLNMIILFGQPLLVDQCLLMPKNTLLVTIKALMDSDTYNYVLCDQAGSVGLPLMISKEVTEERIFCLYVSWRVIVVKWFDNKCFNYHSNGSGTVPLSTIKLWNNKVLHKDCQAIAIYIYWPIISH